MDRSRPDPPQDRIVFLDTLRGATILSMVAFHVCYDLSELYGVELALFSEGVIQEVWRCSISWTFLLLAGWSTSFSHDNLRRGGVYAAAALVVFLATSIASVDAAVNFGILFCMAASTLVFVATEPLLERTAPLPAAALFALLFALTYQVPRTRYAVGGLAWLGFPSPGFSSGDYYPLIPYAFLYLAGACLARWHRERFEGRYPRWMLRDWCPPLTALGRHSLIVYLAHQPLVLIVLEVLLGG